MSDDQSITSEEERLIITNKIVALDSSAMYQKSVEYFKSENYLKYLNEKHYLCANININFEHKFCDMLKIVMHKGGGADFALCYNDARDYTDEKLYSNLNKYKNVYYDLMKPFTDYHDNNEYCLNGKFDLDLYDELREVYSDSNIDMLMKLLDVANGWINLGHTAYLVTFQLVNESDTYDYVYKVLDIKKYFDNLKWCHCDGKTYIGYRGEFDFFKIFVGKN